MPADGQHPAAAANEDFHEHDPPGHGDDAELDGSTKDDVHPDPSMQDSQELAPPVLPPRPKLNVNPSTGGAGSLRLSSRASRPQLQSQATTALSLTGVQTGSRGDTATAPARAPSRPISRKQSFTHFGRFVSTKHGDADDTASLRSFAPTLDVRDDAESILEDADRSGAWKALNAHFDRDNPFEALTEEDDFLGHQIQSEFTEIDEVEADGANEEALLGAWKAKFKHFFILSASGKPIYSRHGDDRLISHYIGVAQTIISFYQGMEDTLRGFTAGDAKFVMLSKGPLNLVAISRLGESDAQLRNQLESLYMQILSTLTLPALERMFSNRPSTDLRRPLEGTDVLLDGLADGFTRGSPPTLLSALECLRLRKTDRQSINDTLLKVRSPTLLYGLIVAAGRLVSVVRPKKHSLHPGDLHIIFNMLFEAGSVRAGEGENWIPLCLPGFNNTGYLYMYVSFFPAFDDEPKPDADEPSPPAGEGEVAIILISANKESFYEMRKMRDELMAQLKAKGSMSVIQTAIRRGRQTCSEIAPGTVLEHFLYKSRGNVQFTMPSFQPHFQSLVARRKLMSLYGELHESMHSRTSHLRVHHCVSKDATSLAWETPLFELYCVAGPHATRAELAKCANKIVQWIRREEERVFIIGGAVF